MAAISNLVDLPADVYPKPFKDWKFARITYETSPFSYIAVDLESIQPLFALLACRASTSDRYEPYCATSSKTDLLVITPKYLEELGYEIELLSSIEILYLFPEILSKEYSFGYHLIGEC